MVGCLGDQPLPLGGTPESPSLKHFFRNWGQETKYYPIALNLSSGNSKGFGSHEPGPVDEDETHMTNISEFGHLNDQIYVFWINPSITVCLRHLPGVESPHMPFWWAHLFFFFFFQALYKFLTGQGISGLSWSPYSNYGVSHFFKKLSFCLLPP